MTKTFHQNLEMKRRAFTTSALVDNIDHNLSSTTAHDSFHSTGISLVQHPDGNSFKSYVKATKHLAESYTGVTSVTAIRTNCPLPTLQENFVDYQLSLKDIVKECIWLKHIKTVLAAENL